MTAPRMNRLAAALGVALPLAMLSGCSDGRSVAAYCEVHATYEERYQSSMSEAIETFEDDPFGAVAQGGTALGDMANMWHALADVAPEEIRADTERVAELMDAQTGADLPTALQNYLKMQGPAQRVDAFIVENC